MKVGRKIEFDDEAKARFLEHLSKTGRIAESAKIAGVAHGTVCTHRRDPRFKDFAEAFDEAMEQYKDSLIAEVYRRGVKGVMEPVFHNGVMVGEVRKFDSKLLAMEAQRNIPEYRSQRSDVSVSVNSGVMVVQAPPKSIEEWQAAYGHIQISEPSPDSHQHTIERG